MTSPIRAFDDRLDSPDAAAESGGVAYDANAQKGPTPSIRRVWVDSAEMAPSMDSTGLEGGGEVTRLTLMVAHRPLLD